jgi:flagellar basal-body rod protein FlgC
MLSAISALSGMQAASLRLTASANNLANINSNGALPSATQTASNAPQPYQPVHVEQTSETGADGVSGVTVARARNTAPGYISLYDPTASFADAQGMVAAPNVDLQNEITNIVQAKQEFVVNANVAKSIDNLVKKMFDLSDN